jgi:ABA DEFICIENT 4-like
MSPEQVFSIANAIAALSWLLLAVLTTRAWVTEIVTGRVVPAIFAVAYIAIIVSVFPGESGGFSSIAGVAALFSNPWLLLAGWLHYLAFDLLIGTWEARDAVQRKMPRLLLVPCLFLTFMFGPAGWLLYLVIRTRYRVAEARGSHDTSAADQRSRPAATVF